MKAYLPTSPLILFHLQDVSDVHTSAHATRDAPGGVFHHPIWKDFTPIVALCFELFLAGVHGEVKLDTELGVFRREKHIAERSNCILEVFLVVFIGIIIYHAHIVAIAIAIAVIGAIDALIIEHVHEGPIRASTDPLGPFARALSRCTLSRGTIKG